ncbi:MAG: hypothetical protein DWI57_07990 [Chloroflexi bacterium]|nr:MAG: hypothetical protein DWI57_07990 [Chloroflexota bacterium]
MGDSVRRAGCVHSAQAQPHPPTALIAGVNLILAGELQALQELNVAVDRDLALMGETTARLLLETISHRAGKSIVLPTQFVIRDSSS